MTRANSIPVSQRFYPAAAVSGWMALSSQDVMDRKWPPAAPCAASNARLFWSAAVRLGLVVQ